MKRIIKQHGEYLLRLDKVAVDALCLNEDSELSLVAIDNKLIVTVKNSDIAKRKKEVVKHLMDKYAPVLEKLAKT